MFIMAASMWYYMRIESVAARRLFSEIDTMPISCEWSDFSFVPLTVNPVSIWVCPRISPRNIAFFEEFVLKPRNVYCILM